MRKFKIGDVVQFNDTVAPDVFDWLALSYSREYIIKEIIDDEFSEVYGILNNDGDIQGVNGDFLSLSIIYQRNITIDEILN